MLFSELQKITDGQQLYLDQDARISRFSIDSRKIIGHPNEVFIAINGERNDGHDFLVYCLQQGIRFFVVERAEELPAGCSGLLVRSGIEALQRIAAYHRGLFTYPIIGITGSNGKTIVKEWLYEIMSETRRVVKSPKSYNSQVGVPLSVLEMGDHDVGIFEAGISKGGEMSSLNGIIKPTIGIFTNLGEAHDQGFVNREAKMEEKARLFRGCEYVICRHEHAKALEKIKVHAPVKTWSTESEEADFFCRISGNVLRVEVLDLKLILPFSNPHLLENLIHAVICARLQGTENEPISRVVSRLRPLPMRLEMKHGLNGCQIIDDSYNLDPMGLETALDFLNENCAGLKKTLIISDVRQNARHRADLSEFLNELISVKKVNRVIHIGDELTLIGTNHPTTEDFLVAAPVFEKEAILIKGARDFRFEKIVERLTEKTHGTYMEVDFDKLRRNLNKYRARVNPGTRLMVMVKASAYGMGLSEVANFLQNERVDYLGVAYPDEAIHLRRKGITLPIMIMNPGEVNFALFDQYRLEAEIYSLAVLNRFLESGSAAPVHIKIDTGMNRLGFRQKELDQLLSTLNENPTINIRSIFTHFSSSDVASQDAFTHEQASKFEQAFGLLSSHLPYKPLKHAVNSPGMIRFPEYQFDMVRLGIGVYGYDPTDTLDLEFPSQLKTYISQVREVGPEESVGYSRKGRTTKRTKIGVIPIGYADGYLRTFGNGVGKVGIRGQLVPTIGNICMDMTMVDLGELAAKEGEEVTIYGQNPTIYDLATWTGTIPYEILTNIGERVKRIYISE